MRFNLICWTVIAVGIGISARAEEIELLPERPYVFSSKPGEFEKENSSRSDSFAVDGAKLLAGAADFGRNAAIRVRVRATDGQTKAIELTLHQTDGKIWGTCSLPISSEWDDVLLPVGDLGCLRHIGSRPPESDDEVADFRKLRQLRFCFGNWLCRPTVKEAHGFEVASVSLVRMPPGAFGDGRNHSLEEFPRAAGETDDTERFVRAIRATPNGVLAVPRGVYEISRTLKVMNGCSFDLDKNAKLRAVKPMEVVVALDGALLGRRHDYNVFFRGGVVDGNGIASCLRANGFAHLTMRESTFLNGLKYGLRVDGGYELMANNLYFKCLKPGLAGNTGVLVNGGDSHYTDCVVVDYTVGFRLCRGGSNRLTRCHVWGGPLPPAKPGEDREMLKDSVNFWIDGGSSTILRDCYADTGKIGFLVDGWDTRLLGCSYFNNSGFKLDGITIVRHKRGRLLVTDGAFVKTTPHYTVYDGCGEVEWFNMMYSGFGPGEDCPGARTFRKKSATDQPALKLAE